MFDEWESPEELYPDWGREVIQGVLDFAKSGEKAPWEEGAEEAPKEEGSGEEGKGEVEEAPEGDQ